MSFATYGFLFLFLPITIMLYFLSGKLTGNKSVQKIILIIASLLFYGTSNFYYVPYLAITVIGNYGASIWMRSVKSKKKNVFTLAVIFNVGLLLYYKYTNFFIETYHHIFRSEYELIHLILPLGISFITFTQILYLTQIYKGEIVETDFVSYCLFIVFFPKIISGPITEYSSMQKHLKDQEIDRVNLSNIMDGVVLFVIGLFKKVVIADSLVLFVKNGFALGEYGMAAAWMTSLFYTLQIYFDFSGYSDMALGIAQMLNIRLPINFNSPYKATGIKDFWERWHITLSKTLSKIVYIPLGGNRKGKVRTYLNVFLTFLVSGIWHGAAWTFILWGMLHGIASVIERLFGGFFQSVRALKWITGMKRLLTFCFVNIAWVLFRADTPQKALAIIRGMFLSGKLELTQLNSIMYDGIFSFPQVLNVAAAFSLVAGLLLVVFFGKNSNELQEACRKSRKYAWIIALMLVVSLIHMSRLSTFIYAGF